VTSLRWTQVAADDLAAIHQYIARDSPRYAQLVVERIIQRVEGIAEFPEAGRIVPELERADIRELISGSYRIVYWLDRDVAHVLTIFRASRLFPLGEIDLPKGG
jgi:plasmid stabilization system protein ParE